MSRNELEREEVCPPYAVVCAPRLEAGVLNALFEGEVFAVRVPGWVETAIAGSLAERVVTSSHFGRYANAPDIGRGGMAFFETVGRPDLRARYYAQVPEVTTAMRDLAGGALLPIDQLRLVLQEVWPAGAVLECVHGLPMFSGLFRVFDDGAEALPHDDVLRRDTADAPRAHELRGQLAANAYLEIGEGGGELEIWDRRIEDEEIEGFRLPGTYGYRRELLGDPVVVLRPQVGELILFDATRVHAVRPLRGGRRSAQSTFIGYRGAQWPLSTWS